MNLFYNLTALIDSLTYLIKILMPLFVLSAHKTYQLSCNARISSWVKSKALLSDILVCNIQIHLSRSQSINIYYLTYAMQGRIYTKYHNNFRASLCNWKKYDFSHEIPHTIFLRCMLQSKRRTLIIKEWPSETKYLSVKYDSMETYTSNKLNDLWFDLGLLTPLSTIFQLLSWRSVLFIGGRNRSTRRKAPTCRKSLPNFIT